MNIGFTSGELDMDNIDNAAKIALESGLDTIELSCLKIPELHNALRRFKNIEFDKFKHISFHCPSHVTEYEEEYIFMVVKEFIKRHDWNIVVHPYIVHRYDLWRTLGNKILIENMYNKYKIWHTADQLQVLFNELPEASFCLDIGHVKQVDYTLNEMKTLCTVFKDRLKEIHVSEVEVNGHHAPLNESTIIVLRELRSYGVDMENLTYIIEASRGTNSPMDVVNFVKDCILN